MNASLQKLSDFELIDMLVSNTPVGYIILDKEYRVHYINDYFMKMRNLTKENTLGRHCYDLSNNGTKCKVCAVESCILTKTKQKVIRKDILPNGEVRFIEDYAIPLYKEDTMEFDFILEIMVNRTSEMLYREMLDTDFINLITSLITMLDAKDEYTATHSKSVAKYSVMLAKEIGLSVEQITDIEIAASLHDIGKVNIPDTIINKPSRLTEEECDIIKMHPGNAYVILQRLAGFLKVKEYVRYHHERYDGKGYPNGIAGNEIPLGARIISLADTYDAIISTRSYKNARSHETALEEIKRNSGTQFDPVLVDIFLKMDFERPLDEENSQMQKKDNLVERFLVETEEVKARQKDSFMEQMDNGRRFTQIISEQSCIREIFSNTPVAYAVLSPQYDVLYTSPHFLDTFGFSFKDIQGKKCYKVSGCDERCSHCPMEKAKVQNKLVQTKFTQTIDSKTMDFDCFAMPYYNEKGELQYLLEILLDRTEEKQLQKEHEQGLYDIIQMLMDLLAVNDHETFNKSKFISQISTKIAQSMELPKEEQLEIEIASTLCDIGMISLKDTMGEKRDIMYTHPVVAYSILERLSIFENVQKIVKYHHENYDGSGFPGECKQEEIPLGSRIIALADTYYEYAKESPQNGAEKIREEKGKMFDPVLADIFLAAVDTLTE